MRRIESMVMVAFAACFLLLAAAHPARAQLCGDADGDGALTDTDAVNVLRAAAALPSSCSSQVCDLDGDGQITDTDGVRALRAAAALPTTLACPSTIMRSVASVETADGSPVGYSVGGAPLPGPGAPMTVNVISGNSNVIAGGSNTVTVQYTAGGASAASAASSAASGNLTLVVAVADLQGNLVDGFFEIPLSAASGSVTFTVFYPQNLGSESFLLCPATRNQGVLSEYGALRQDPIPVTAGTVQVSLSFQPSQDVDLHLVEPGGEEIFYNNRASSNGGMLDLDSNPGCFIDGRNNENITYPVETTPPRGEYIVRVDYFQSCDGGGASFTVVVNNGGVRSTFPGSFAATDADGGNVGSGREITRFTFPP